MVKELDLVEGIYANRAAAWKLLYVRYYAALCHYALKILKDSDIAMDVVQGVMVYLWEHPLFFENESLLRLYLYRAVNNNSLQYLRNKDREDKRLQEWVFFADQEEAGGESLNAVVGEEVFRKLHALIESMPAKRKEVILLSMKRMSNDEIAENMQITVHAVKKHKKEAYAYIRQNLGEDLIYLIFMFPSLLSEE